jgi:hypothetical protein
MRATGRFHADKLARRSQRTALIVALASYRLPAHVFRKRRGTDTHFQRNGSEATAQWTRASEKTLRMRERIIHGRDRIERRAERNLVVRAQVTAPAKGVGLTPRIEPSLSEIPWASKSTTQGGTSEHTNMDRLADEVIRKIDYRLSSYRERLGKAF